MSSPDRSTISTGRAWLLTALVAAALWASLSSLPGAGVTPDGRSIVGPAALLCSVLAMFGLRSVPIRWVVRAMSLASGALLARFGELGALEGVSGSWKVLLWLGATAAALALAPSSRAIPGHEPGLALRAADVPVAESTVPPFADAPAASRVPVSLVVAAVALVGAAALLVGPRAAQAFPVGARVGDALDLLDARQDNALVATERLDMTARPRLTDEVVMTVRSPLASFWRTETFDLWDGSAWTRSDDGARLLTDGEVVPASDDVAAASGDESTQEFRIEIGYATAVPSAPSAVRVDSPFELAQREDGTLASPIEPMGNGTVYTVTSRQVAATPEQLAAVGDEQVPAGILSRYAEPPVATDRVRQLATEITEGATTDLEKVERIEDWLDANTEYSLDAPLSPKGVDVVDDFLFESQLGWCEQIASSLVVLARSAGVPARLATGFTPGEWDPVGGRFVVREKDAHAWAEVWFPQVGWITFDPTASVPLAGTAEATPGANSRDWREIGGTALVLVALVALLAGPTRRALARWRSRRRVVRSHRVAAQQCWDVRAEDEIERRGRAAGLEREPGDTLPRYAQEVATAVQDPTLVEQAEQIEQHRYGPAREPVDTH